ncbi:DMT family transporter [Bacillus velezensis]|uniref:DMT family transporter n=1 Tax=Bacillus velezensis TaxID=492670 RepID=UPI0037ED26F0|nr:DMT family transporter [Bacillus velezensis]MDH3105563.1 DMT family transporter [Bacillus velezensis]MDH3137182.1 DMT family transporter [Bacillus velezensis]
MFKIISAIIIVTFVWGYLWVPTKIGLGYISPFFFTALRLFTGALPLFLIQILRQKDWIPAKRDWKKLITMSLFMCLGYYGLSTFGMQYVNSGLASVLVYTMPIIVSALAHFFLQERLTVNKIIGLFIGLAGLLVIIGPQWSDMEGSHTLFGELTIILAVFFWACANIYSKKTFSGYDTLKMTFWQMLIGGLMLLVISAVKEPIMQTNWSAPLIWSLLYAGLMGSAVAFVLWFWILQHIDASIASIALMAVPILGLFFGWLQLHEPLTANIIYGAVFVCLGIFFASVKLRIRKPKNEIKKSD